MATAANIAMYVSFGIDSDVLAGTILWDILMVIVDFVGISRFSNRAFQFKSIAMLEL